MQWQNLGKGGATITGVEGKHKIGGNLAEIKSEQPNLDYLILEGGTNDSDLVGAERLGSFESDNKSGTYDETTFSGALEKLLYNAVTLFPYAKIGFIVAHTQDTSTSTRSAFFDRTVEICEKWGVPYIDLRKCAHLDYRLTVHYDSSLTPEENMAAGKLYKDGQHLTYYGYEVITPKIEAWMKTL
jgi:lysophospholipase L1-like esterase